ncbi:class I SAM-dependent methyltransferase [uncultured Proteiniphilum sp.]|uniref:class I SAM-dependent methyltransferase n=1 Tax=uncultured Proteiniphilum sp. TaxID=497637 RepID=UPI00262D0A8C|nr:class I SAM-dependent methyltransferase [uncultured Proteiniphilum sp.]
MKLKDLSIEESVVTAMDGDDAEIFPYLPYILQDFWEIGSSPSDMIELIEKHTNDYSGLKVLDLGCGKGAVSIRIAEKLESKCWGFDGVCEFIEEANRKAKEYKVKSLCHFEKADIRDKINELRRFDVIILGAIGQVFGDYYATLTKLKNCLEPNGIILIDDAYIDDLSTFNYSALFKKNELLRQISEAGMELIDEKIASDPEEIKSEHEQEFDYITFRCNELIKKHPEQKSLFENYMKKQREEYEVLENCVVCLTMVIKEK